MQFETFQQTVQDNRLPAGINVYLQAMWFDALGDWNKAHQLVDHLDDGTACWVHAYLHRKEGDIANAGYWYRRAGKTTPLLSLAAEWELIVKALL